MRLIRNIAIALAALAGIAGALSLAGGLYVRDNVTDQLTAQQVFFAPKGSDGLPADIQSYGGTQVTNGAQAKVFADRYISDHIEGTIAAAAAQDPRLADVNTYSQASAVSRANPGDPELEGLVETVFRGEMLRGSLLSAWGWWTFGTILLWAGVALLGTAGLIVGGLATTLVMAARKRPAPAPVATA